MRIRTAGVVLNQNVLLALALGVGDRCLMFFTSQETLMERPKRAPRDPSRGAGWPETSIIRATAGYDGRTRDGPIWPNRWALAGNRRGATRDGYLLRSAREMPKRV